MKICNKCKKRKSDKQYYKTKQNLDGLYSNCKDCHSKYVSTWQRLNWEKVKSINKINFIKWYKSHLEYYRKRSKDWRLKNKGKSRELVRRCQARKLNQFPLWANLEKIKQIYINCPKGKVVDHIVPLKGRNVSGFHVEYNLQYLTAKQNRKKHNKF